MREIGLPEGQHLAAALRTDNAGAGRDIIADNRTNVHHGAFLHARAAHQKGAQPSAAKSRNAKEAALLRESLKPSITAGSRFADGD